MKVLQLIATRRGLYSPAGAPNGGLESVILNLHEAFVNAGWDSHYTDIAKCHAKSSPSIRYDLENDGYKTYANAIQAWIDNQKPDLVIAHGTNALLGHLTQRGIRVLFVEHSMTYSINLLSYGKLFGEYAPAARAIGSKIITVSEITVQTKREAIAEFGMDFEFDGWCRFQFPTQEFLTREVQPSQGYCVTVARCERQKSIGRMLNHCVKHNMDWRLVTYIPNQAGQDIFDKEIARHDQSKVLMGIDRAQTLNVMNSAAILGSSCTHESAGVTAFEGLMLGLPLLLNETPSMEGIHASRMFLPNDDYIATLRGDHDKTLKLMNLSLSERKSIRELAIDYNPVSTVLHELKTYAEAIGTPQLETTFGKLVFA